MKEASYNPKVFKLINGIYFENYAHPFEKGAQHHGGFQGKGVVIE